MFGYIRVFRVKFVDDKDGGWSKKFSVDFVDTGILMFYMRMKKHESSIE